MLAMMLIFLVVFAAYRMASKTDAMSAFSSFRIFVNHMQITAIFNNFNLKWPKFIRDMMSYIYAIFAFDIGGAYICNIKFYIIQIL